MLCLIRVMVWHLPRVPTFLQRYQRNTLLRLVIGRCMVYVLDDLGGHFPLVMFFSCFYHLSHVGLQRNMLPLAFYHTILKKTAFENVVGKGENAGNQHFLLFPQCFFYPFRERNHLFSNKLQILDYSKLKEFADDNFNFFENGKKLLEKGRREIVRYEQFLLSPQCFQ